MSEYTPTFNKPYPDGWKDKPDETTPATAEIMDAYDDAIENIETYLSENPINKSSGDNGGGNVNLTDLVVENSISMGRSGDIGVNSVATGTDCEASGDDSHAEGYGTIAEGEGSHAEGGNTTATGDNSHAEGYAATATGDNSHAEGYDTIAASEDQHVQGRFNAEDAEGKYAHIVGGGTSDADRKNIHTVDWYGNAEYAGVVKSAGLKLTDTATGQEYIVTVSNGSLSIQEA